MAGVYGLNRAYNATLSVLRSINEENREAAQFTRDAEPGLALLGQVTTGGDDFARLQRDARNIFRSGAADSLDQAARTRFQLRSAGLESDDDISLFTSLGSSRLIADLDNLARSAATIFRTLGTEEVGDTSDLISKAFGASDFATATAEEILRAASASGGSARALGLGDEEILGRNCYPRLGDRLGGQGWHAAGKFTPLGRPVGAVRRTIIDRRGPRY